MMKNQRIARSDVQLECQASTYENLAGSARLLDSQSALDRQLSVSATRYYRAAQDLGQNS